jgi:hypothetical protein
MNSGTAQTIADGGCARKLLAGCAVFPALSIVANAKALDAAI